jgi:hypothetical protein
MAGINQSPLLNHVKDFLSAYLRYWYVLATRTSHNMHKKVGSLNPDFGKKITQNRDYFFLRNVVTNIREACDRLVNPEIGVYK